MMDPAKALLTVGLVGMVLLQPSAGEAQLREVRQTIFGMDCAPCAYAVERRMGALDGAAEVRLSLNEGFAEVRFGAVHGTTLERIRRAIRDSGFGARDARVRVQGSVALEEGVLVLRTPVGERFRLEIDDAALPEVGAEGELRGRVAAEPDAAGRWVLTVGHRR
jgi:copper chaperone CopZ